MSKVEIGLQELEKTAYWLELLMESEIVQPAQLAELHKETGELIAIFVTCVRNIKRNKQLK